MEKKLRRQQKGRKKKIWTACPTSNLPAQHARALAGQVCHKLATWWLLWLDLWPGNGLVWLDLETTHGPPRSP